MNKRVHVIVSGRVQGVNFRRYTQQTAQGLGVSGWVRNLPDGSVEGCFEGEKSAVDALVAWCKEGPSFARVDRLELRDEPFCGEFSGFQVRG
jgi:acylphosphatase